MDRTYDETKMKGLMKTPNSTLAWETVSHLTGVNNDNDNPLGLFLELHCENERTPHLPFGRTCHHPRHVAHSHYCHERRGIRLSHLLPWAERRRLNTLIAMLVGKTYDGEVVGSGGHGDPKLSANERKCCGRARTTEGAVKFSIA